MNQIRFWGRSRFNFWRKWTLCTTWYFQPNEMASLSDSDPDVVGRSGREWIAIRGTMAGEKWFFFLIGLPCYYYLAGSLEMMVLRTEVQRRPKKFVMGCVIAHLDTGGSNQPTGETFWPSLYVFLAGLAIGLDYRLSNSYCNLHQKCKSSLIAAIVGSVGLGGRKETLVSERALSSFILGWTGRKGVSNRPKVELQWNIVLYNMTLLLVLNQLCRA